MLLILMVTSKGMAGVPRASLVVIAATLATFNIPEAGLLLIMGIDQFLDMGRSATNVVGNSIATAVVAKWEGELQAGGARREAEIDRDEGDRAGARVASTRRDITMDRGVPRWIALPRCVACGASSPPAVRRRTRRGVGAARRAR